VFTDKEFVMRRLQRCWLGAWLSVFALAAVVAPAADAPQVPDEIRQKMQDRDFAAAVAAIDAALATDDDKLARDHLAYLKGRALHLAEQYDDAVTAYEAAEQAYPDSPWARRSKFGRALSLARKGDFRGAEVIYREEVTFLLSVARKQELAGIYLEFADGYFKPQDETVAPDYAKALDFYLRALEVGPEPDRRTEVELLVAQCYQALGNLQEAANRFQQFAKDHPASPLEIEARYRLGECQLGMGLPQDARRTWQDLLADRGDSQNERIAEAALRISETYALPNPGSDEDLSLGVASLEAFLEKFPEHALAGQAHLRIAQSYVYRGRYEQAVAALARFLADERLADREQVPQARALLGDAYQMQQKFTESLAAYRDFLAQHPAHELWSNVQGQIIQVEYLMALVERQEKRYDRARELWLEFLARYPLDSRNPGILLELGAMLHQQDKLDEAMAEWRRLVSKYPGTEEASQAQYLIGLTLEEGQTKFEDALKEYRKVTWGSFYSVAQGRIALLTSKSLSIATPRVFRSDETPTIQLTARNIDKVTVRAYTVDLETYFRKMHLATGVEGLDIALIDPDASFEFEVPDYAEYQLLEREVEVPLPKAGDAAAPPSGVLAVTVSSPTLEATTMVVQSDLDVIVKSSRDEVFVFAENLRTGEPWPGARLLVSNGSQVFAEAETGADGVFQHDYTELHEAADVRVFAVAEGHVASNIIGLDGLSVATGLSDRGYIYTDRPAYRAGQVVHVRGVVRRADGDQYTIDAERKHTVDVFDPRGRLLRQEEVALGKFGSFHLHFVLPQSAPVGGYRVQVRDEEDRSYEGSFTVHEYQLEPVRLSVETGRHVYYRGEEIEGKIVAQFYYGAPLAGREIRYQLAGGRIETATTDDNGEVPIRLATRDFREAQTLPLVVVLPERNLQTAVNFYLATQGFSIAIETPRDVYVAGETFEATLRVTDAEGEPLAQKLVLRVLERTAVDGRVGEREVQQQEIESDAEGLARVTLRLEEGASYVLRAEGIDRFKNVVTGERVVQVSDDKDTVRLRILADKHTYRVGDEAKVVVHWREAPALALVTFQGARVLGYQLVHLQTGANELPLTFDEKLAPNFELCVSVMTDDCQPPADEPDKPCARFHEATSPFGVERGLNIALELGRKDEGENELRPGDEVEVVVRTTDPQGRPVAAEVSLAMVEQALLDRFGASAGRIGDFFHGGERQPAVRSGSSITFVYNPQTREIDRRLLAERERLEVEAEEALSREEEIAALADPVTSTVDADSWQDISDNGVWEAGGEALAAGGAMPPPASLMQPGPGVDGPGPGMMYPNGGEGQGQGQAMGSGGGGFGGGLSGQNGHFAYDPNGDSSVWYGDGSTATGVRVLVQEEETRLWANFNGPSPANADDLYKLGLTRGGDVLTFSADGEQKVLLLNDGLDLGRVWDAETAHAIAEELIASGTLMLATRGSTETGYWNPTIVTAENGEAVATFTLPERSTAWRLAAAGITETTMAGQAETDLAVKKDLFGELKLPLAFTDGDQAQIVATVHNAAIDAGQIKVTLKATVGGKATEETMTLDVTSRGLLEVPFAVTLARPADAADAAGPETDVVLELTVTAGEQKDVVQRSVPLVPYGLRVFATASGSASSDISAWVDAPAGMALAARQLQVIVGPTIERGLLDIVLGAPVGCQIDAQSVASGLDTATADLMASLALQKLLAGTRAAGGPHAAALDERVRAALALLVSSQNDDGGWSWTGNATGSNRYTSVQAVWGLTLARKAGYSVPQDALDRAIAWLQSQVAATPENEYETKAILLHGLAAAGQGDFALANRLYRSRPSLSNAALAHLALAFVDMDRKPTAGELLELLGQRNLDDEANRRQAQLGSLPWSASTVEVRALYALGWQLVNPQAPVAREQVEWLMAHRTGHRWAPDKATGPAALAVCTWYAQTRFDGEQYTLAIFVNDRQAAVLELGEDAQTRVVEVPAELLQAEGKQRVNFQLTGRGRYSYQVVLGGFVPADQLKSTTGDWNVQRNYEPAPLELDGMEVPRGFGVVAGNYTSFRNPLTQLPVGKRGLVELVVWRTNVNQNVPEDHLEYLVVTEPIPSGATVIENSITGGFERFEIQAGAITFYIGTRHYVEPIRYQVHGYLPGEYRAGPTVIRDAYRPDRVAVSEPKALAVLPLGEASGDEYRLSPQELYELGRRWFDKQDMQLAARYLGELVANWNLQADYHKESARMLLDAHLQLGPPQEVVRYFEVLKERWPELELPFEKIVRVGAAYDEMGEYERSYLIFRATIESSFQRESGVAGFLESQGEFVRSVDVMRRLLGEYPPEPYLAAATYYLAQRVYAKAPEAAADPKLRERKINRIQLVRQALGMLDDFLTQYPEDPAADQAAFSAANALLEMEAYEQAIARCLRYEQRYPDSQYLDSYWFIIGFSNFALSRPEEALAMCRKVSETPRVDPATGRETESPNKWQAVYIQGQVHHSLGQAAEAIAEYERVSDRFPDAQQAIDFFARKAIALPEVTTVEPGQAAEVELSFRNVPSVDTRVYRIDLMKFSLLKRNLGGITGINLAGIRPLHEATIELGDGKDYRDRTKEMEFPLEEEGAYLVVCRGEDLHASGLVLVTPLVVEVQEDVTSGRVRTTVKDKAADKFLTDVHVKTIGSYNDDFISGQTDLRGVFVADGIVGRSTVIAQADGDRYAFFRGEVDLGPVPQANEPAQQQMEMPSDAAPQSYGKDALLQQLQLDNDAIIQEQNMNLQKLYQETPSGVQVQEAY
jgi:uncharacterized protein YfaS (alpha-2-macroglobulin family)/TolA-binding protein